jgi:hypothetical protein
MLLWAAAVAAVFTLAQTEAQAEARAEEPTNVYEGRTALGLELVGSWAGGELGLTGGFAVDVRRAFALEGRLGAGLEVGFHRSGSQGSFQTGPVPPGLGYSVGVTTLPLTGFLFYRHPLNEGLAAYVNAGGLAAYVRSDTESGGGVNIETGSAYGGELTAGAERALGPGLALAELGYRMLVSGMMIPGAGNLAGPSLRLGYRLLFWTLAGSGTVTRGP